MGVVGFLKLLIAAFNLGIIYQSATAAKRAVKNQDFKPLFFLIFFKRLFFKETDLQLF